MTNELNYAPWALIIVTTILVVITGYYAWQMRRIVDTTREEAKKNRRKDTIEKSLENLYSPLYEILIKARYENPDTLLVNKHAPAYAFKAYIFTEPEFIQIRGIIERYGHYLEKIKLDKLRKDLGKIERLEGAEPYPVDPLYKGPSVLYLGELADLEPHELYITDKHEALGKELQDLTRI